MAGTLTNLHYLEDPGIYLRPGRLMETQRLLEHWPQNPSVY